MDRFGLVMDAQYVVLTTKNLVTHNCWSVYQQKEGVLPTGLPCLVLNPAVYSVLISLLFY